MNCETVSDLLPALANGSLDATSAVAVREHVASCDDCAAELSLIITMRVTPAVPVDLVGRINAAVSARPVVSHSRWDSRWSGFGARQLTIAATIAVALIGGGVAVQQMQRENGIVASASNDSVAITNAPSESVTGGSAASPSAAAAPASVAPAALGTSSVLSEMSEAQLEALLKQMGS